ncbi:hypothetical protein RRG08_048545 [Elysia crispata]|uniref:Uncharacterized protein n=1 Tax=Elysia crispata TaxID=231223 RepID=A0AAE1B581_9GAST|nr:hypothetical protein RRG08_048545 [Elysia crispata]
MDILLCEQISICTGMRWKNLLSTDLLGETPRNMSTNSRLGRDTDTVGTSCARLEMLLSLLPGEPKSAEAKLFLPVVARSLSHWLAFIKNSSSSDWGCSPVIRSEGVQTFTNVTLDKLRGAVTDHQSETIRQDVRYSTLHKGKIE